MKRLISTKGDFIIFFSADRLRKVKYKGDSVRQAAIWFKECDVINKKHILSSLTSFVYETHTSKQNI